MKLDDAQYLQENWTFKLVGSGNQRVPSTIWIQAIQDQALEVAAMAAEGKLGDFPRAHGIVTSIRAIKNKQVEENPVRLECIRVLTETLESMMASAINRGDTQFAGRVATFHDALNKPFNDEK